MLNDAAWICAGSAKQHELLKVSLDRHVLEHDLLHVSSSEEGPCGTPEKCFDGSVSSTGGSALTLWSFVSLLVRNKDGL